MIAKKLAQNFPFVSGYFTQAFSAQRFPQSIVFEGSDPYAQLFIALECARNLNCIGNAEPDCECINCRWIRQNAHPAINLVSQMHYKPSDDESKTVISAKQAKNIEHELLETSDYHRFYIFFDAKPTAPSSLQKKSLDEFSPDGYNICPDLDWSLGHLNRKTFNPATPNILLKSVEEPPERTTFVFLTRNKSDLISTLVSRSQVFSLAIQHSKQDIAKFKEIFGNYPDISYQKAFEISENLQIYIKDSDITVQTILDYMLECLTIQMKNCSDSNFFKKINTDISYIRKANLWASSSMSDKTILDTLMLKIARNAL